MEIIGFGFRPTEEELVDYYLKHRLIGDDPRVHLIPDIDLCEVEPWDVPMLLAESAVHFNLPEWFFFSPVDFKYSNSKRVNRTTKCGFWKPTGKDRDIRSLDTNTLLATKKTLVYYKGRISRGVKSNWVIHEYHAVTFHESQCNYFVVNRIVQGISFRFGSINLTSLGLSFVRIISNMLIIILQRTFVLCRLMKKPEKTTENGSDALTCDEGEPSRIMVSGYENQAIAEGIPSGGTFNGIETTFQPMHQAENYFFSPLQQSPIGIEQEEASFPNSPFYNAHFRNEKKTIQIPFETTQEDEFLNSILVDDNFDNNEESIQTYLNSSTQSESFRKVYCESSDTDSEAVSQLQKIYCPNIQ
ncbi:unnamed protein product [Sphenostylis stenocarpa]|uniref:NAC domain-containing protein n=1 Tax=Sphenostylis stenocarpa TaxID=92480 RepID=A0AA86SHW1_9FABA|nr:unnamed protein product [Sphenostylis stenocarpa]